MTKLVLILLVALVAACNPTSQSKTEDNKNGTDKASPPAGATSVAIAVGDIVVAKWSANSFYEGKVESIDGSRARVAWSDNSSPSQVEMSDVYMLPKAGSAANVKVGDVVLAKRSSGTNWNGAEVVSVDQGVVAVKYTNDGTNGNLPPDKIIAVSPVTAADFKSQSSKTDFSAKAQAGNPVQPPGYKPKSGERVVAEWTAKSWYSGRIKSVAGGRATVAWDDNSSASDLVFEKIIPYPTAASRASPRRVTI